jgi:N-acetylmuramoyl-L-alanine amidase
MNYFKVFFVSIPILLFTACSSLVNVQTDKEKPVQRPAVNAYYDLPSDFRDAEKKQKTIDYYSDYLRDKKIFLDPGHGGRDRYNKSYEGRLVEADINLRVAKELKDYLESAGADVIIAREDDSTVELQDRVTRFNKSDSDIFISIHHNAAPKKDDYWTNYTSTFYHARPNDYEYEPSSHDLAKYIQRDLSYAIDNSGGLGSFDGTYSDYRSFPGEGFYVLREIKRPGVLVECAFHTNIFEEKKLIDEQYNSLEAWGIFRGIGRYFAQGIPEIELLTDESKFSQGDLELVYIIKDKTGMDTNEFEVYYDKKEIPSRYSEKDSKLFIKVNDATPGEHNIRVICENKNGIHNFPYSIKILIR